MRRRLVAIAAAAAMMVAATPAALPAAGFRLPAHQIACESWQFRRAECPADTRGGVRLLQVTGGLCTRGQSWGMTPRGVWVSNGCRAIFAVVAGPGGSPPTAGRVVVCASWRFQPARCAADLRHRPRIEVIAGTCEQGRTWSWDRHGIAVKGGCRARFILG